MVVMMLLLDQYMNIGIKHDEDWNKDTQNEYAHGEYFAHLKRDEREATLFWFTKSGGMAQNYVLLMVVIKIKEAHKSESWHTITKYKEFCCSNDTKWRILLFECCYTTRIIVCSHASGMIDASRWRHLWRCMCYGFFASIIFESNCGTIDLTIMK